MYPIRSMISSHESHPARGAWIEIYLRRDAAQLVQRRTPQGVRGLKSLVRDHAAALGASHPARGAWIEISSTPSSRAQKRESHPARGAWIEINPCFKAFIVATVAPRKGCVD